MPVVIAAVVLVIAIGFTAWSSRRTRRRILGGSADGAAPPIGGQTPQQAANQLRATIDAENGRGYL